MKKYISPEIEAVVLNTADCITLSEEGYAYKKDKLSISAFGIDW